MVLFVADTLEIANNTLGALRNQIAKELDMIDNTKFNFLWVVDWPMFEWSEEEGRYMSAHHPFTLPTEDSAAELEGDLSKVRAVAYDIVLNGYELGGGSLRINQKDLQERMLKALGFSEESAYEQFGFLLEAMDYGFPPHGGLALGLDRFVMLLAGKDNIREVIAFPKNNKASDPMTQAPSLVADKQLEELPLHKYVKYIEKKSAKKMGVLQAARSISREKYTEKFSASVLYGLLSSIAVNFFFQPGHVYSSGSTGLAQMLSALSLRTLGFEIPVSLTFYAINIPLLILAWYKIGHKFTIFTFITVTMSSLFIQVMPHVTLTEDPLINAIFGGLVMGAGIGFGLKSRISSGGTDIVSLTIRKKTGRDVGNISLIVNGIIMIFAGILFGWKYALYSMVTIFISSRVTDAIFTKQKKMQAMIVTSNPDPVIRMIHKKLHRGVTMINDAEGTYNHEKKAVLLAIITREEYTDFKYYMRKADPKAFVSIAENVHILGRFVDLDD